jgi:adenosylcobinamide-phosphate guanylyltransferase
VDALVMAGGKGRRMGYDEKPLLLLRDRPLISYVLAALAGSRQVDHIYVAVSFRTPGTLAYVKDHSLERVSPVMTPGSGYIGDMAYAVHTLELHGPVLVVSADLPLLTPGMIDEAISAYARCGKEALSVRVDARKTSGEHDTMLLDGGIPSIPAGINIVHGAHMDRAQDEYILILEDEGLALNVNYKKDLAACERLLAGYR